MFSLNQINVNLYSIRNYFIIYIFFIQVKFFYMSFSSDTFLVENKAESWRQDLVNDHISDSRPLTI